MCGCFICKHVCSTCMVSIETRKRCQNPCVLELLEGGISECWGPNPRLLGGQPVLFSAKPTPQPPEPPCLKGNNTQAW